MGEEEMAQLPAWEIDLASTLASSLDSASSSLSRSAVELSADVVAVLFTDGPRVEITYFWSRTGGSAPSQEILDPQQEFSGAIGKRSGPVEAESPLAQLLRDSMSLDSRSFLLFHWRVRRSVVTVVFGFVAPAPPYHRVPAALAENLSLYGLAAWSVKEIARLQAELKIVNGRLASRKLVERAKGVLQVERGLSEQQAYEYMRGASRRRRIPLAELAEEVLGARSNHPAMQPDFLNVAAIQELKRT
jgi:hypothetical protein